MDTTRTLDDLRADHFRGFRSASDEAWERDPVCRGCGGMWPCDTATALGLLDEARATAEKMRGDVRHHVNPVIGSLRLDFHRATDGVDPLGVPNGEDRLPDVTGLPETIAVKTSTLVSWVRRMRDATDAADEALASGPSAGT